MVIFFNHSFKKSILMRHWLSGDLSSARGSNADLCDLRQGTLWNSGRRLQNGTVEERILKTPTSVWGRRM